MVVIGIHLGTSNSSVGLWRRDRVEILANKFGYRTSPCFVAFTESGILVGNEAFNQKIKNPTNTVYDVVRLMGRRFDDPVVQEDMKRWPFTVVDVGGKPRIHIEFKKETKTFAPEQISAMILRKMKEIADKCLDCDVKDAVITVPAYFNDDQRQATTDAGKIAGLKVLRIINESTAAALAYVINTNSRVKRTFLVYHQGGTTFDVSIVKVDDKSRFNVLATSADNHLGGIDIDNVLVKYIRAEFLKSTGNDINKNMKAIARVRIEVKKVKHRLSSSLKEGIYIDCLMNGEDLTSTITRPHFEQLCSDLLRSTLAHVDDCLKQATLRKATSTTLFSPEDLQESLSSENCFESISPRNP